MQKQVRHLLDSWVWGSDIKSQIQRQKVGHSLKDGDERRRVRDAAHGAAVDVTSSIYLAHPRGHSHSWCCPNDRPCPDAPARATGHASTRGSVNRHPVSRPVVREKLKWGLQGAVSALNGLRSFSGRHRRLLPIPLSRRPRLDPKPPAELRSHVPPREGQCLGPRLSQ